MIDSPKSGTSIRFLADISWRRIHSAMQSSFADYSLDMSYMTERFLELRSRKNGVDLSVSPGLFSGDELVGFTLVGVGPGRDGLAAFDSATGIKKEWRGKGFAGALFNQALPELRSRGVRRFVLEVLQENQAAVRAYEKTGFRVMRELDCFDIRVSESTRRVPAFESGPSGIVIGEGDSSETRDFVRTAEWPLSWECGFESQKRSGTDISYYIAREEKEAVGFAAFHRELSWLMAIQVKASKRRQGIGMALLDTALAEGMRAGGRVRADNIQRDDAASRGLLVKRGFKLLASQFEMELQL